MAKKKDRPGIKDYSWVPSGDEGQAETGTGSDDDGKIVMVTGRVRNRQRQK